MARPSSIPIDPEGRMLGIALVDLLLIAIVLGFGLTRHAVDPVARPGYLFRTVAPFWVGWAVAATAFGAYTSRAPGSLRRSIVVITSSWAVAVLIGGGIRAMAPVPGGAPPIFLAATIGVGLCVLLPWRVVVTVLRKGSYS